MELRYTVAMRQVLQDLRSGETRVVDVPIPAPQPGTALVRTVASLVSAGTERGLVTFAGKSLLGKAQARPDLARQVLDKARREGVLTTLEAAFNRLDQPLALGYSSAGTVVEVGPGVTSVRAGDRVACAGGGHAVHAEYALVPENLLTPLPEGVDFESAAFTTLGAIALHGFRLARPQIGERLAVVGLGLLGLLTVEIAAAAGCHILGVDVDPDRVELARELGAEAVPRARAEEAARAFSRGRGCDAVLICAAAESNDPVELAGDLARDRARVVAVGAVGMQIPRKVYYEKELTFLVSRSYGPGRYDPDYEEKGHDYPVGYVRWTEGRNLEAFVELLGGGRLDVRPLISHRYPIERAPEAYALITGERSEPYLGVLLTYPERPPGEPARQAPAALGRRAGQESAAAGATDRVGLGVIGAGNFATAVLLPALRRVDDLDLVGVVSASGVSARAAQERFGFRYAAAGVDELFQDETVNTVAVLTRHHMHAAQTLAALKAGRHVFCEKPLGLHEEQIAEIENVVGRAASPLLMVGFNRRFAPMARRLSEFLADRREPLVGHYRVNAGALPPDHWLYDPEQGGGRIIGEACHFIDFLTFLVGVPPASVTAHGLPDDGRYREDNVVLTLTYPEGSLGTVTYLANGDRSFAKERLEVFAAGRVAVLDDYRRLELIAGGRRTVHRSRLRQDKGHRDEWRAFVQAILEGGAPPIPYDQLFGVSRAALTAVHALRSGETIRLMH